jgi:hypothetical protein
MMMNLMDSLQRTGRAQHVSRRFLPAEPATFAQLFCSRERVIVIRGVHWNLNLRELHDSLHGEPRADDVVRFIIAEGALILSRSPDLPALRTGIWPYTNFVGAA